MPHFIVEYTANIKAEARIPELLRKGVQVMADDGYPVFGMRGRALEFTEYLLVDGEKDYAMVHATLKIAPAHTTEEKKRVCDRVFAMMKDHFAEMFTRRYLLLSLELIEIVGAAGPTLKLSNVQGLFEKVGTS
jgi:5-carboxymethyl-2-hydroxymuconate isomerase